MRLWQIVTLCVVFAVSLVVAIVLTIVQHESDKADEIRDYFQCEQRQIDAGNSYAQAVSTCEYLHP